MAKQILIDYDEYLELIEKSKFKDEFEHTLCGPNTEILRQEGKPEISVLIYSTDIIEKLSVSKLSYTINDIRICRNK